MSYLMENHGCKKHRTYQAKRKPRCQCEACWNLWYIRDHFIASKAGLATKSPFTGAYQTGEQNQKFNELNPGFYDQILA
jgi:hypothetical protein